MSFETHPRFAGFRALLPEGTELCADTAGLSPGERYQALTLSGRMAILPDDPGIVAAMFDAFAHPGPATPGVERAVFGIKVSAGARWPVLDLSADEHALVFRTATMKDVALFVRRADAVVEAVVKCPLNNGMADASLREFHILENLAGRGINVAPRPIASGTFAPGDGSPARAYTAQSFVTGGRPEAVSLPAFKAFAEQLTLDGLTISVHQIADDLRRRIDRLSVSQESRSLLLKLLDGVRDRTELPAAIGHGDFWIGNLIDGENGLTAIDWEYSRQPSISYLDFMQAAFTERYLDPSVTRLSAVLSKDKVDGLNKYREWLLPPQAPGLSQFFPLHFVHHYVDRVEAYGGLGSPGLSRLDALLHSGWSI